ncbi:MAG: O-antigen ligase family protein [Gammaproteobacteria bacterium]
MSRVEQLTSQEWWRPAPMRPVAARPTVPATGDRLRGKVAFRSLMAFLFVLLLSPQSLFTFLQPLHLAFVTAGIAVFAFLASRMSAREPLIDTTLAVKLVGLIVAWSVITVPFSHWPGGSVAFLFEMYFKTLVVFLLLAHVIDSELRLRRTAWAMTLMSVPLAVTGLSNYVAGDFAGGNGRILGYDAPLTMNPNDLALTLNLILPLTIGLFLDAERLLAKAFLVCVIALAVGGVVATFSRSGFLTLAVIGLFYAWRLMWRGRAALVAVVAVLGIGAAPFLPGHYWDRLSTITAIEEDTSGSAQERWHDTKAAATYVAGNPIIGAGIGQGTLAMNEVRGARWLKVHNVYLEYAVELGIPGLVLFVLLLGSSLRSARLAERIAAHVRASGVFHLSEAVRASLIGFAVAAMFHPAAYHFWFYMFAGLALAARAIAVRELREAKP